ncbi:uncharacterized protein LOC117651985, partial [Thrips palmi]|uniref:Uncharacterized protein LOC117651985 n=1 Tax=Thrips palmi TaxID=161013 RepID=A0A6P9A3R7_THRPL
MALLNCVPRPEDPGGGARGLRGHADTMGIQAGEALSALFWEGKCRELLGELAAAHDVSQARTFRHSHFGHLPDDYMTETKAALVLGDGGRSPRQVLGIVRMAATLRAPRAPLSVQAEKNRCLEEKSRTARQLQEQEAKWQRERQDLELAAQRQGAVVDRLRTQVADGEQEAQRWRQRADRAEKDLRDTQDRARAAFARLVARYKHLQQHHQEYQQDEKAETAEQGVQAGGQASRKQCRAVQCRPPRRNASTSTASAATRPRHRATNTEPPDDEAAASPPSPPRQTSPPGERGGGAGDALTPQQQQPIFVPTENLLDVSVDRLDELLRPSPDRPPERPPELQAARPGPGMDDLESVLTAVRAKLVQTLQLHLAQRSRRPVSPTSLHDGHLDNRPRHRPRQTEQETQVWPGDILEDSVTTLQKDVKDGESQTSRGQPEQRIVKQDVLDRHAVALLSWSLRRASSHRPHRHHRPPDWRRLRDRLRRHIWPSLEDVVRPVTAATACTTEQPLHVHLASIKALCARAARDGARRQQQLVRARQRISQLTAQLAAVAVPFPTALFSSFVEETSNHSHGVHQEEPERARTHNIFLQRRLQDLIDSSAVTAGDLAALRSVHAKLTGQLSGQLPGQHDEPGQGSDEQSADSGIEKVQPQKGRRGLGEARGADRPGLSAPAPQSNDATEDNQSTADSKRQAKLVDDDEDLLLRRELRGGRRGGEGVVSERPAARTALRQPGTRWSCCRRLEEQLDHTPSKLVEGLPDERDLAEVDAKVRRAVRHLGACSRGCRAASAECVLLLRAVPLLARQLLIERRRVAHNKSPEARLLPAPPPNTPRDLDALLLRGPHRAVLVNAHRVLSRSCAARLQAQSLAHQQHLHAVRDQHHRHVQALRATHTQAVGKLMDQHAVAMCRERDQLRLQLRAEVQRDLQRDMRAVLARSTAHIEALHQAQLTSLLRTN